MDDAKSTDEDYQFLDASDEFPFYDCLESHGDSSSILDSKFSKEGLRRRRSMRKRNLSHTKKTGGKLESERVESTSKSFAECAGEYVGVNLNEVEEENSVVTMDEISEDSTSSFRLRERENHGDVQFSLLIYLSELIVKAIGFQFNLLISFVSFPFWVLYYSCMVAFNPLFILGLGKSYLIGKVKRICKFVADALTPYLSEWLNEHKSLLKLVLRCGWGLFWSVYVGLILVTLLISAFVIGGLMLRYYVVEESFELKQGLNFDYTKSNPAAFVPIVICPTSECEDKSEAVNAAGFIRVIPPRHKLQATVTMVLPESNYNRNLGIFQVRVEYLSENGKSLASFSHPCMLEFKSQPLRLLLTFFKIVPLVAGYLSETQILKLNFRGYSEGVIPTACLKITIEHRAEFRTGAGIPEIYDASVHLESELPFLKRIIWYWRRTIFVWLSMMVFTMELLFALICCRPVIYPRPRIWSNTDRSNTHTPVIAHAVQR